jgi:hypothetical protein
MRVAQEIAGARPGNATRLRVIGDGALVWGFSGNQCQALSDVLPSLLKPKGRKNQLQNKFQRNVSPTSHAFDLR